MEALIREGTLRLQTSDSSCDVILNCQGQRLMAHKLILSIASPVLRELLTVKTAEPTVLIFPDVSGSIMTLILDYIYTGSVVLYSNAINEFLSIAFLLKLRLDDEYLEKSKLLNYRENLEEEKKEVEYFDIKKNESTEVYSTRNHRRLPNLLPLESKWNKRRIRKSLCDHVLPSPWRSRITKVFEDPKKDHPIQKDWQSGTYENDNNNNFHYPSSLTKVSKSFQTTGSFLPLDCHSVYNRFSHMEDNSQMYRRCSYVEEQRKLEDETVILNEEKYHSSDDNRSVRSISSRIYGNEIETSKYSNNELHDETIRMSEENQELVDSPHMGDKETENRNSKCDDNDKNKPFSCEDCGKSFSQLRNYKYHRSLHEGTKEFAAKCQECGKVFNDRGYLSSHMKIHRDKKEYACSHCPKRFNQRVAYNMHLRIHTGVKPHECHVCGKSFSRKMLLKQHQRVHTGERPYSCPECGKTFADRSNMSLHARLHTGVKPYACSLCPKSFTKKHHLKTHMNFHTGLKPYSCEKCGLSFSQSSNMRTHYKKCILKGTTSSSQECSPGEEKS